MTESRAMESSPTLELVKRVGDVVVLASEVSGVTLFEDRAEVLREALAPLKAGVQWIALSGATPFIDDRSVQARILQGAARVLAARVVRRVHHDKALGREAIESLEADARAALRRVRETEERLGASAQALAHVQSLHAEWVGAVGGVPRGIREDGVRAAWREAHRKLEDRLAGAVAEADAAREARVHAHDEHAQIRKRLTEGQAMSPRHEARIEVRVEADAACEAHVEVTYRTPAALWRPEHSATLSTPPGGDGRSGTLEIVTCATAWQRTGETWRDVRASFSTARPAEHAAAPLLTEDVLASRRKTDEERKRVVVEAREQAIQIAGLDRAVRAVDEMPGVDDGGVPSRFEPAARASLPPDGRPTRVEIARVTLRAEVALVVWPERAPVAHVRATATLASGAPILAGPVNLTRAKGGGGAIAAGRSRIDYVGSGEPFELGFGTDDTIRVRRKVIDENDTVLLMGTQRRKRTVAIWVSNLGSEPKRVTLIERVPVSEIDGVDVSLADARGWRHDAKDGFMTMELELAANDTKGVSFAFEVRAAGRVSLPGF